MRLLNNTIIVRDWIKEVFLFEFYFVCSEVDAHAKIPYPPWTSYFTKRYLRLISLEISVFYFCSGSPFFVSRLVNKPWDFVIHLLPVLPHRLFDGYLLSIKTNLCKLSQYSFSNLHAYWNGKKKLPSKRTTFRKASRMLCILSCGTWRPDESMSYTAFFCRSGQWAAAAMKDAFFMLEKCFWWATCALQLAVCRRVEKWVVKSRHRRQVVGFIWRSWGTLIIWLHFI